MGEKRDFIEIERMPGWAAYQSRVEARITSLTSELSGIDTEGKSAEQVGLEHVKIEREIAGLKQLLMITEEIKNLDDPDL